jgi:hypothetical protein
VEITTPPAARATVGSTVAPAPAFLVRDAAGRIVSGAAVTVTVTAGGGTLTGAPRRTAAGPTPIGTWVLGTRSGPNVVRVQVGSLPPLDLTIDGVADAPATLSAAAGDGQNALAGDFVTSPLSVKLADRFGNGVSEQTVRFAVVAGEGSISAAEERTGADGVAGGVRWQLGARGGEQRLVATAGTLTATLTALIRSDFQPIVRFFGSPPSAEIQAAFTTAAERLRAAVIDDLEDVPFQNFNLGACGVAGQTLTEVVDDVVVYASVRPIDGVGRILASAGPCITRSGTGFATIGIMSFDLDDVNNLVTSGRFGAVVLHELMHVVGFGTLWRARNLLFGVGTTDPRFSGSFSMQHCVLGGGVATCVDPGVPVENTGGSGTAEVHWRESVFDIELMTGFAEATPNMPLSSMSLGSLEDLGHLANYKSADAYLFPGASARLRSPAPAEAHVWEILEFPRFDVTPGGWVRPIPR